MRCLRRSDQPDRSDRDRVRAPPAAVLHPYYGDGATSSWITQAHSKLHPFVSGRAYQNYIDPTLAHWQQAYYDQNLPRLKATRQRVDPDHYFNFPQAIGR